MSTHGIPNGASLLPPRQNGHANSNRQDVQTPLPKTLQVPFNPCPPPASWQRTVQPLRLREGNTLGMKSHEILSNSANDRGRFLLPGEVAIGDATFHLQPITTAQYLSTESEPHRPYPL